MTGSTSWIRIKYFSVSKFFILILLLISSSQSIAQDFEIDLQEASMEEVILELESQFGGIINYSSSKLDTINRYSFSSIGTKEHVLRVTMSVLERKISKLDEENYVLGQDPPNPSSKILPSKYNIQMIDPYGDPLPFGLLEIKGTYIESDADGNMEISGFWSYKENITLQYLGYKIRKLKIGALAKNKKNQVVLQSNEQQLGEVVISFKPITRSSQLDEIVILPEKVSLAGFTDGDGLAISQRMAGVYNSTESLDDLQIRGGTPDQTEYLWNGIRLLQNSLFYGKIASVNPLMTNQIKVNKSGSTAAGENQGSSSISNITDLRNLEKISLSAYADLTHTNVSIALPFLEKRIRIKGALRNSMDLRFPWSRFNNYFEQSFQTGTISDDKFFTDKFNLNSQIRHESFFNFSDLSLLAEVDVSKKVSLKVFKLSLNNQLDHEESLNVLEDPDLLRIKIRNKGSGAELAYQISSNLKTKAYYRQSTYDYNSTDYDDKSDLQNSVKQRIQNKVLSSEFGIRSQLSLKEHHFNFDIKQQFWDVSRSDIGYEDGERFIHDQYQNNASETSAGLNYNFNKKWIEWNLGAQVSKYSKSDYRPILIEPRLQLLLKPSHKLSIFANYGHYHQSLSKNNLFTPIQQANNGFWFLADESNNATHWINRATTQQFSVGIEKQYDQLTLMLEGYHKQINDVWTGAYLFTYEENPYVYVDTKAYGLELTLKYNVAGFHFYNTLNWSDETLYFTETNSIKSPFYQPLRLGSTVSYKYKNWTSSLTWQFASGRFYSVPSDFEEEQRIISYTNLLTAQSPNYHRLDLSIDYKKEFEKVSLQTGIGILNLYNRNNVISNQYYTDYRLDEIAPSLFTRFGVQFSPEVFVKVSL